MGPISRWMQNSSPLVKMTMAIAITSAFAIGNKYFYAPYERHRRLKQAEGWANEIIEQEERIKEYDNY